MRPGRRLLELVLAVAVVATVVLTITNDRVNSSSLPTGAELGGSAQSSALYCTGFSGAAGIAPAEVVFTNTTRRQLAVSLTIVANTSATSTREIKVAPEATARLTAPTFPGRAFYGVVALVGGGGVTAQVVGTGANHDVAPCAPGGAGAWGLAGLSTHVGTTSYLTLLNPTRTEATVDITALTPNAVVTPGAFQGVVVGPLGEVAVPLNAEIVDATNIALAVRTTHGAVVAAAAMAWAGRVSGAATVAGSPGISRTRTFPDLPTNAAAQSTLDLANPTGLLETISVRLTLGSSSLTPGPTDTSAIAPFVVTLPGFSESALMLSPSTRVPAGGPASIVVHATGDVVAQLLTRAVGGGPWFSPPVAAATSLVVAGGFTQLGNLLVVNRTGVAAAVELRYLRVRGTPITVHVRVPARSVVAVGAPSATARYLAVALTSSTPVSAAGAVSGRPNGVRIVPGSGGR